MRRATVPPAVIRISNELTPNFHQGVIAYAHRTVAVACLRDAPLLALAVPRLIDSMPSDWSPLTFVDVPVLAAVLAEATEFRLLTATELAGSIDLEIWPQISRDEIRYWKPETRLPRQDTKAKTPARHHVKRE